MTINERRKEIPNWVAEDLVSAGFAGDDPFACQLNNAPEFTRVWTFLHENAALFPQGRPASWLLVTVGGFLSGIPFEHLLTKKERMAASNRIRGLCDKLIQELKAVEDEKYGGKLPDDIADTLDALALQRHTEWMTEVGIELPEEGDELGEDSSELSRAFQLEGPISLLIFEKQVKDVCGLLSTLRAGADTWANSIQLFKKPRNPSTPRAALVRLLTAKFRKAVNSPMRNVTRIIVNAVFARPGKLTKSDVTKLTRAK